MVDLVSTASLVIQAKTAAPVETGAMVSMDCVDPRETKATQANKEPPASLVSTDPKGSRVTLGLLDLVALMAVQVPEANQVTTARMV
jgi:hypothetical protein